MPFKSGHFGPAKPAEKKAAPPKEPQAKEPKPKMAATGEGSQMEHASKHGTSPHPQTGVHAVAIHHHGDHVMTHTHHDGGQIESMQHGSLDEAHQHAQEQLPPDQMHQEPDADDQMAGAGDMSGLDYNEGAA